MLGDRRLAQSERLHQLRYVRVSRRETSEDSASCGICKRAEGQAKKVGLLVDLHVAILPYGDMLVKPSKAQIGKVDASPRHHLDNDRSQSIVNQRSERHL